MCESLRYYDAEHSCYLREDVLRARARRIANNIDCVIDMDDAQKDADRVCRHMGLAACLKLGSINVSGGTGLYKELFDIVHVCEAMERAVKVVSVLHDALMERRCRQLKADGRLPNQTKPIANWAKDCGGRLWG